MLVVLLACIHLGLDPLPLTCMGSQDSLPRCMLAAQVCQPLPTADEAVAGRQPPPAGAAAAAAAV